MPRYTVGKFLQDREHWNRMQGHHPGALLPGTCNNNTNNNSNGHGVEFKRRRHVPKSSTSIEGIVQRQKYLLLILSLFLLTKPVCFIKQRIRFVLHWLINCIYIQLHVYVFLIFKQDSHQCNFIIKHVFGYLPLPVCN